MEVNTAALMGQYSRPDVAMNGAGDFVVVWHDFYDNFFTSSGRRFASDGSPIGVQFPLSTGAASAVGPHVASDGAGNFLVAWQSEDADGLGIAARYWDIGGFSVSSEFVVNEITTGYQFHPDAGVARDGTFVVSWTGGLKQHAFDVKGRKSGVRAATQIELDLPADVGSSPNGNTGNGVWEPGETVIPRTAWVNDTSAGVELSGSSPLLTGPAGADYTLNQKRRGLPDDCGRRDRELFRSGRLLLDHRVGAHGAAGPALGRPSAGDTQHRRPQDVDAPHRRELPRRTDRPPVLCVHRESLSQRRNHRLRGGGYA